MLSTMKRMGFFLLPWALLGCSAEPPAAPAPVAARSAESGPLDVDAAVARVLARYRGQVLDVDRVPPRSSEQARAVVEVRLLTEAGHVLRIRLDADDGSFLEVDGRGLVEARRP